MPTYYSPPSSPPRSRATSQSRSRSRTRSTSPSISPSPPARPSPLSKRNKAPSSGDDDTRASSAIKTSLIFLGAIGAATFCAHKYWPKGITYGDKEEWEIEKAEKKVDQQQKEDENAQKGGAGGGSGSGSGSQDGNGQDRGDDRRSNRGGDGGRGGPRSRPRSAYGAVDDRSQDQGDDGRGGAPRSRPRSAYGAIDDRDFRGGGRREAIADSGPVPGEEIYVMHSRSRREIMPRSRSRDAELDAYVKRRGSSRDRLDPEDAMPVYQRSRRLEPSYYYPPAPPRYVVERIAPVERIMPAADGRRPASRYIEYDLDGPGAEPEPEPKPKVVYVYRDAPSRSRTSSVDGRGRRYEDERYSR